MNETEPALASPRPTPTAAAVETPIVTIAPLGNAAAGVKTRTVLPSAQATLPAIDLPAIAAAKAGPLTVGFIGWVNRTDSRADGQDARGPVRGTEANDGRGNDRLDLERAAAH